MKTEFTDAELRAAYDICILMEDHTKNVLATQGFEGSKSDEEWRKKASKFVKAYETIIPNRLAKSGKAGSLGKALIAINGIQDEIKKIKQSSTDQKIK